MSIIIPLFCLLNLIQATRAKPSSDHHFHLSLIKAIKNNQHKFVHSHPNRIGEKNFAYPQLFHWIISFLPMRIIDNYYIMFSVIVNILQLAMFLFFLKTIFPSIDSNVSYETFILLGGLIFIFTPFSYAIWNAKIKGISARGFGLLLGQLYLYLVTYTYLFDNFLFLGVSFLVGFLIIISSQFAMQYLCISAILFALFSRNPFFLLIPVFSLFLFYLIMPEIAENFTKGQLNHKRIYYRYLSEKYILKIRPSIWRDFVSDFASKIKVEGWQSILYIYYNPVVSIFYGFPFLILFCLHLIFQANVSEIMANTVIANICFPILISLLVFLLTSFRRTRFLGEPERYIEFCMPHICILGAYLCAQSQLLAYVGLGFSVLMVIVQFVLQQLQRKHGSTTRKEKSIQKLLESIWNLADKNHDNVRIFSNNSLINKRLISGNWKVLNINLTSLYTGKFHFNDIYPVEYPYISSEVIIPLLSEFNIHWFILDTEYLNEYDKFSIENQDLLEEKWSKDTLRIYRVCLQNS